MHTDCPRCDQVSLIALLPHYRGVVPFVPALHQDPEIRLLCENCGWLHKLENLQAISA